MPSDTRAAAKRRQSVTETICLRAKRVSCWVAKARLLLTIVIKYSLARLPKPEGSA